MRPAEWLLVFIARCGPPGGLDPVRLQKGMFLLAHEGGLPGRETYRFVPYNYGPMSAAVYRDLDALVDAGLVERVRAPGHTWRRCRGTPRGAARADALVSDGSAPPAAVDYLERTAAELARMSFSELILDVYQRYPRYAARSVFRRA